MSDADSPVFAPGDVVYGTDPFKRGDAGRPWLIISNHPGRPFHGEQYIGLTLTTSSWLDGLVEIPEGGWIRGGTPEPSRIAPWAVQSIGTEDIEFWQGRLDTDLVSKAVDVLTDEITP